MEGLMIQFIFIVICFALAKIIAHLVNSKHKQEIAKNVEELSYKNYANFYGQMENADPEFKEKITKIYDLIIKHHYEDIKEIAKRSNCTYQECIIKIQYMKYKKIISGYYVDHRHGYIKKCDASSKKLISKYEKYIYGQKLQTKDIARRLTTSETENIQNIHKQVKKEIKFLIDNDLLEGVIYNEIDDKLIYYVDEGIDIISVSCKHCGAVNDIHKGSKKRCAYCNSIINSKN